MKVCVVPWEVGRGILVGMGLVVHGSMMLWGHSHGHISSATRSWAHVPMVQAGLCIMLLLLLQMMIMWMWMEWSVVMLTVSSSTAVGIVHRLVVIIDTHCGTGLIRIGFVGCLVLLAQRTNHLIIVEHFLSFARHSKITLVERSVDRLISSGNPNIGNEMSRCESSFSRLSLTRHDGNHELLTINC